MQNVKYHLINIAAVVLFSCSAASAITQSVRYVMAPAYTPVKKQVLPGKKNEIRQSKDDLVSSILGSGMFKTSGMPDVSTAAGNTASAAPDLTLLGTVTGPSSISRAVIGKSGEKDPKIYALYNVSKDIGNDVYGNKLIRIGADRVWLESNGQEFVLELFAKPKRPPDPGKGAATDDASKVTKSMSRAEIKQTVLNDLDNAMKGLVAGPYRKNGKLEGYVLKTISPENILYRFGLRNGDIIKRVNGKELNSTEKLYTMWQTMQNEPKITADVERSGRTMTFDLNITE
jgi:type II secretion system protein C